MPGGPGSWAWVGGPGPSPPGRKLQRRWKGGLSRHGAGEEPEGGLRSGGGGQGPRTPPVGLPAWVVACCHPATIGHLHNSSGLRASDPPPRRGRAGRCSSASWTPGQRRVKDTCSLPLAPSPLESPRNDVSTRQLKKFNYRDRFWELEQTWSVGGARKQLRSKRARLAAAPRSPRPWARGRGAPLGVG